MIKNIEANLNYSYKQIETVIKLTEEGYTVPFIARYRKELTNNLSELDIQAILQEHSRLTNLEERKQEILSILTERNILNKNIEQNIKDCDKLVQLEELYKPYKKKQKTKATIAREQGLEEVADGMLHFRERRKADFSKFVGKKFSSQEEVLENASHILIEDFTNNLYLRNALKEYFSNKGFINTTLNKAELDPDKVFKNYYDFHKPLKYLEPFQILAINRGIKQKILKSTVDIDIDLVYKSERILRIRDNLAYYPELVTSVRKAYNSNLKPSLIREIWNELTDKAEKRATKVFTNNLRAILLKKPLKTKAVIGLDPGFRTGCKVAVVDKDGNYLAHDVIYPVPPHNKINEAQGKLVKFIDRYNVDVIAIGDGTASYETTTFVSETISKYKLNCRFTVISESGASVYSASKKAVEEFPNLDLTIRSAISIARRVQSFLDEVIKIPPESIGVGMYQHDITPKLLKESLAFEVNSVVHHVGVDINKASSYLLEHISGISASVAKNIVEYRHSKKRFSNRKELMDVKGFGKKAFELASGFCRVADSTNPLDNTIIHPDKYPVTSKLLRELGYSKQLAHTSLQDIKSFLKQFDINKISLKDISKNDIDFILSAILNRDIDPRESLADVSLLSSVPTIEDFVPNSVWDGEVKNVTDFGIFVNLGIKVDGLIHVSRFPSKKIMFSEYSPGEKVTVIVEDVDIERKRIQLKLKD